MDTKEKNFDHNQANLADKITVIGNCEHLYYHAKKSASVSEGTDKEVFHQVLAKKVQDFRRNYMHKYFPNISDEMWCEAKAVEALRQRVYESDEGDADILKAVDELWNLVWSEITGQDMSGCKSCAEDRNPSGLSVMGPIVNGKDSVPLEEFNQTDLAKRVKKEFEDWKKSDEFQEIIKEVRKSLPTPYYPPRFDNPIEAPTLPWYGTKPYVGDEPGWMDKMPKCSSDAPQQSENSSHQAQYQ